MNQGERSFMTELQEYMTTGMLGGYRPENAVLLQ